MKPILIFQVRSIKETSDNEFEAILKYGKLTTKEVVRIDLTKERFPKVDLSDYSAIIIGGGSSNVSDLEAIKSKKQKEFEAYLITIMQKVIEADFPYLGACYGLGILGLQQNVNVSTEKYGEKPGAATVFLTDEGKKDKLLEGFPDDFRTFLGHKESWQSCPIHSKLLISSKDCPVHMVRIGENVYATQFHPELDFEGVKLRAELYKNAGYFKPEAVTSIIEKASKENIIYPMKVLENFVKLYKK
ncbi:MAG TPA: glutamine amidotransferase [Lutibacter sp.]|nr:glutamine amidotransferase [Lutibacter sp.]